MRALTGAQVMALGEDAKAIESGVDSSALGGAGWMPATVDRVLKDGDTVTLGGVTLTAHHTPGHTKGCTTWTTTVKDGDRSYAVTFVGGTSINEGVRLVGNIRHPGIIDDYARTFRVLEGLQTDVFLAQHGRMYQMEEKMKRVKTGGPNPFIDREGYKRFVADQESQYLKQLASEESEQREARKRFVGTWSLVSIDGGANTTNRGGKPTGVIYYDATGHMAAQIQPDRERPRWTGTPTPEQAYERWRGYTAYFGTYTIDAKAGTVTHHREGMLDPGAVDFVRKFEFAGDRLILTPVGGANANPAHLTWERLQ
jgi:glyoxylase-like metal-dependent hydrolase (beta-lactamase superfamily II)